MVAIENQLEWTDIGHLGQLLTYATGCDAQIAIWVAPEFRYELAEVLHWLNHWTVDGVRFYGVKIEVVKKADGSTLEPRFRKVVYPGVWNKKLTQPPGHAVFAGQPAAPGLLPAPHYGPSRSGSDLCRRATPTL